MAAPTRITTRATNQDAHPGLIAYDSETDSLPVPKARRPRRSAAEMKEERAAKLAKKEAEALQSKKAIQKVAQVENGMAAADTENRQNAARPPAKHATKVARKSVARDVEVEPAAKSKASVRKSTVPVRPGRQDVQAERDLQTETEVSQKRKASFDQDM